MRILFCLLPALLLGSATDPWSLEPFASELSVRYEHDHFGVLRKDEVNLSLLTAVWKGIELDAQASVMKSRQKRLGFQKFFLGGKWQLLDEFEGDWVTLTVGGAFFYLPQKRLGDLLVYESGHFGTEWYLSTGREWSLGSSLQFQLLTLCRFLPATFFKGPYSLVFEGEGRLQGQSHGCRLGITKWRGGGREDLQMDSFSSYRHIRLRFTDLFVGYSYRFQEWGELLVTYLPRLETEQFPSKGHRFMIEYRYPFSFFAL